MAMIIAISTTAACLLEVSAVSSSSSSAAASIDEITAVRLRDLHEQIRPAVTFTDVIGLLVNALSAGLATLLILQQLRRKVCPQREQAKVILSEAVVASVASADVTTNDTKPSMQLDVLKIRSFESASTTGSSSMSSTASTSSSTASPETTPRTTPRDTPPQSPKERPRLFGRLSESQLATCAIKAILNKLTRDNFDRLLAQLLQEIAKAAHSKHIGEVVNTVANEFFKKATMQHGFVELYADACVTVHKHLEGSSVVDSAADFKKTLAERCNEALTQYSLPPPPADDGLSYEEQYEDHVKYKTAMLGNALLTGHLLRREFFSQTIALNFAQTLVAVASDQTLETLSVFLDTMGDMFDDSSCEGYDELNNIFVQLEKAIDSAETTRRVRFLIMDLVSKRKAGWASKAQKEESVVPLHHEGERHSFRRGSDDSSFRRGSDDSSFRRGSDDSTFRRGSDCSSFRRGSDESTPFAFRRGSDESTPFAFRRVSDESTPFAFRRGCDESALRRSSTESGSSLEAVHINMRGKKGSRRSCDGKWTAGNHKCTLVVGIDPFNEFNVVGRLIGEGGSHMKQIITEIPDAKVRLRGQGSGFCEGPKKREANVPLMFHVQASSNTSLEAAVSRVEELLEWVHTDYQVFHRRYGTPEPESPTITWC